MMDFRLPKKIINIKPVLCKKLAANSESENKLTIKDLQIGEYGWIVPWSVDFDIDGQCSLNLSHSLHGIPGGTSCVKAICVDRNRYILDVSQMYKSYFDAYGWKNDGGEIVKFIKNGSVVTPLVV